MVVVFCATSSFIGGSIFFSLFGTDQQGLNVRNTAFIVFLVSIALFFNRITHKGSSKNFSANKRREFKKEDFKFTSSTVQENSSLQVKKIVKNPLDQDEIEDHSSFIDRSHLLILKRCKEPSLGGISPGGISPGEISLCEISPGGISPGKVSFCGFSPDSKLENYSEDMEETAFLYKNESRFDSRQDIADEGFHNTIPKKHTRSAPVSKPTSYHRYKNLLT